MNSAGNAAGNAAGALAPGLLATVAVSGGAQSAQLFGPAISGNPVMTVPFADLAPGSVIFSEHITDPTVITTTTGGGVASGSLLATEGVARPDPVSGRDGFGGMIGSFNLDLEGPGFAQVSLNGKVRTTVTTPVSQAENQPFSLINIGPNTLIDLSGLGDVKYILDYDFSVVFTQGAMPAREFRLKERFECRRPGENFCLDAYDFNSDPSPFLPAPGLPLVFETSMSYTASLESLAVEVSEPAPASLMVMALALLGIPAVARRR
jgi:hypothetical protein